MYPNKIVYVNAGLLMMPHNQIIQGGKSAPRNESILKMFNMVGIGERGGTGIPKILNAAKEVNYLTPTIEDNSQLMDTTLTIYFEKLADSSKNLPIQDNKLADLSKNLPIQDNKFADSKTKLGYNILNQIILKSTFNQSVKNNLLSILNEFYNTIFSSSKIESAINCSPRSARDNISYLKELDIIEHVKGQGKGKYKFK